MSDTKVYGPEQENAFFQGVLAAADEKSAEWGVESGNIIGDFVVNALACLLVEADKNKLRTMMTLAHEKADLVLATREFRASVVDG